MPEQEIRTGECLCGAVRFSATLKAPHVGACHCAMCRRWSTGPFMAIECDHVAFEGEEHITRYRSSDWAERGFCSKCGSNLFYKFLGLPDLPEPIVDTDAYDMGAYGMGTGLFHDQSGLQFTHQVYVDKKPNHYAFANQTHDMTEADILAIYAPEASTE